MTPPVSSHHRHPISEGGLHSVVGAFRSGPSPRQELLAAETPGEGPGARDRPCARGAQGGVELGTEANGAAWLFIEDEMGVARNLWEVGDQTQKHLGGYGG